MGRKFIIRLLLSFSLLAALALGGCGTNPEPSESKQKNSQSETVITNEEQAREKTADTSSSSEPEDAETVLTGKDEANGQTSKGTTSTASSELGNSGKASVGNGSSSGTEGGEAAGSGNTTNTSGKAGSGTSASSGTTSSKSGSGSSTSTASPGSTVSPGSTSSSGSTASTGGTGSSGTSGSSQPSAKPAQKPAPAASATITITGPDDAGVILAATKVEFKDGDTVLDLLLKAAGKKGIDVDYTGSGPTAYVVGIDNYYEFDYGSRSGWISKKNGKSLEKGAGIVKVSNGDRIEWVYTEDFLKKE
ncbi:DUF4430 domain-containing protein [Neobacillus sp. YIM B06451]|uniref:DUF4430 domain-containing protein n=1 Tax=Neobacillus sp. YIM B06451 TaxID=3070994 RepID=UPI0029300E23|nr:DUF4430 domain-containing protein [Neobacillus sp. YIM B06451]